jgi:hypothetical protein
VKEKREKRKWAKEIGRGRLERATYNRKKSEQKWAEEWRKEAQSGDWKTISAG